MDPEKKALYEKDLKNFKFLKNLLDNEDAIEGSNEEAIKRIKESCEQQLRIIGGRIIETRKEAEELEKKLSELDNQMK